MTTKDTGFTGYTRPAIAREQADAWLAASDGDPFVGDLMTVLTSSTISLICAERAGLFRAAEMQREVARVRSWADRELAHLVKARGGLVTISGHDPETIRTLLFWLDVASKRLVLADREAHRLWDLPVLVEHARKWNAQAILNPGHASSAVQARWTEWRNRHMWPQTEDASRLIPGQL